MKLSALSHTFKHNSHNPTGGQQDYLVYAVNGLCDSTTTCSLRRVPDCKGWDGASGAGFIEHTSSNILNNSIPQYCQQARESLPSCASFTCHCPQLLILLLSSPACRSSSFLVLARYIRPAAGCKDGRSEAHHEGVQGVDRRCSIRGRVLHCTTQERRLLRLASHHHRTSQHTTTHRYFSSPPSALPYYCKLMSDMCPPHSMLCYCAHLTLSPLSSLARHSVRGRFVLR